MESKTRFQPEEVDLADLASKLRNAFDGPIEGSIVGRTRLRDAVASQLQCSHLQAEQLVDTMIGRGFLKPVKTSDGLVVWRFREESAS